MADARELRWELHDHFAESRDYRHLLRDSEDVMTQLHALQRAIFDERALRQIDRELELTLESLSELREHVLDSDYARARPGRRRETPGGYVFIPDDAPRGRVHVDAALE